MVTGIRASLALLAWNLDYGNWQLIFHADVDESHEVRNNNRVIAISYIKG